MIKNLILAFIMSAPLIYLNGQDPYLWLEEVDGENALEFVERHNQETISKLQSQPVYQQIFDRSLEIYNSQDRIAYPTVYGNYIYNFWQDAEHVRGIWRRMPRAAYLAGESEWEILLDLDAMSQKDGVLWVYKDASGLYPDYDRFLVSLSKGGGDATVKWEFDVNDKSFVDDGFRIGESKGFASYVDPNTLIVATNFGDNTMTASGYPRQARLWKRGTPLSEAELIYEIGADDVGCWGYTIRDGEQQYVLVSKVITTFKYQHYIFYHDELIQLEIPDDAGLQGLIDNQLILLLKTDWTVEGQTYPQGDLISVDLSMLLKGKHLIQTVYHPDALSSIEEVSRTKNNMLVNLLTNVKSRLRIYNFRHGQWEYQEVPAPDLGTISVLGADDRSDQYFFTFTDFLTPSTLYVGDTEQNTLRPLNSLPAFFDASKYAVHQYRAQSKDGTEVPYFVVAQKGLPYDGKQPTLIYAYGGFEVSKNPGYSAIIGNGWLENGGVYVLANIRGGGEFGPKWHQDGMKEQRQNVFDDFYAVAEDVIARKISSPAHLGIYGGSNGGLLVGVAFTQRPDLYNAVVCAVPLLDMERYHKLLAGASWIGEYGNPDIPEEWAYISKYSPYHNVKPNMRYPEVLFMTSTRDDRVHPGHARKMVAKMEDLGYHVYYYENTEGGHAGSSTNAQRAKADAVRFTYLLMKLK